VRNGVIGELISAEDATPAAGRIAQNSYFAPAPGFLAIRGCTRPAWPDREKIPCLSFSLTVLSLS